MNPVSLTASVVIPTNSEVVVAVSSTSTQTPPSSAPSAPLPQSLPQQCPFSMLALEKVIENVVETLLKKQEENIKKYVEEKFKTVKEDRPTDESH